MKDFFTEADSGVGTVGSSGDSYISIRKANALIRERSRVVYGWKHTKGMTFGEWLDSDSDTHQALIICIEPIEKPDSAESLLGELLAAMDRGPWTEPFQSLKERARKLLAKEGE